MRPRSVRAFCLRLLESGSLEQKLEAPDPTLEDRSPGPPLHVDAPERDTSLRMGPGAERLPRPEAGALSDPAKRARCLARFAHHELMAAELFAWALLRWPQVDPALRRVWLHTLADEQRHCALYLERLHAHASELGKHAPHSDYFWKQVPAIAASPHGPRAFVAALGLTLEQANLDFAPLYRDAFRAAGDEASARVCDVVHQDEIRHVRRAAEALQRLDGEATSLAGAYAEAVPFPLSASRAKGRRFDAESRRRAGLPEDFVELVRHARSTTERRRS